ncbi:cupredoxin domain-containing protein [Pseudomaricurvus albidus]|uniref:cupredoxin domain-containing protein n=1 Tax=Pseudomaricurvus albidus TaxID=2842452 RepID=UPI001F2822DA
MIKNKVILQSRWVSTLRFCVFTVLMNAVSIGAVWAAPTFTLEIKNHLFYPAEIVIPANTKVRLRVINRDDTPEEFESYELNREKVILGNSQTVIFVGPLPPGEYPFFGEFNISTAQGKIIAR